MKIYAQKLHAEVVAKQLSEFHYQIPVVSKFTTNEPRFRMGNI